jgi:H+-transporting ATPase
MEPMPLMLWTAALIQRVLGNYSGMCILLGIQFISAGFSFYETSKAVAELKEFLKPLVVVKRDGRWQKMDAALLVPGDLVKLAAGCAVPADCYVNDGEIEIDQSVMTGESLPVKFRYGDVCKMGSTVTRGESDGTVETTAQYTFFGKTAAMVQNVENAGGMPTSLLGAMKVLASLPLALCMTTFIFMVVHGNKRNDDGMFKNDSAEMVKVGFRRRRFQLSSMK